MSERPSVVRASVVQAARVAFDLGRSLDCAVPLTFDASAAGPATVEPGQSTARVTE